MVPGGGFEPPTRGFSIRCSTPELPGPEMWASRHVKKAGYTGLRFACLHFWWGFGPIFRELVKAWGWALFLAGTGALSLRWNGLKTGKLNVRSA